MSPTNRERSCRARSKRRARKLLLAACPVGFALDWLFFRPVYWIGSHQPFRAIFGRTDSR
jgi:hypothetical protein